MATYISVVTTAWVMDEPCGGLASELEAATDGEFPEVPGGELLVDGKLASALESNEPADITVP